MKHLVYTTYRSGEAGLSNLVMSIEVGVILAHLTNRFLVLDGNNPPTANIVWSGDRVNNGRRSKVTDLIDLPIAWGEPGSVDLIGLETFELTDRDLSDIAFYFPRTLNLSSSDARSFARGRDHWLTMTDELDRIPVLRLSEDPIARDPTDSSEETSASTPITSIWTTRGGGRSTGCSRACAPNPHSRSWPHAWPPTSARSTPSTCVAATSR